MGTEAEADGLCWDKCYTFNTNLRIIRYGENVADPTSACLPKCSGSGVVKVRGACCCRSCCRRRRRRRRAAAPQHKLTAPLSTPLAWVQISEVDGVLTCGRCSYGTTYVAARGTCEGSCPRYFPSLYVTADGPVSLGRGGEEPLLLFQGIVAGASGWPGGCAASRR